MNERRFAASTSGRTRAVRPMARRNFHLARAQTHTQAHVHTHTQTHWHSGSAFMTVIRSVMEHDSLKIPIEMRCMCGALAFAPPPHAYGRCRRTHTHIRSPSRWGNYCCRIAPSCVSALACVMRVPHAHTQRHAWCCLAWRGPALARNCPATATYAQSERTHTAKQ